MMPVTIPTTSKDCRILRIERKHKVVPRQPRQPRQLLHPWHPKSSLNILRSTVLRISLDCRCRLEGWMGWTGPADRWANGPGICTVLYSSNISLARATLFFSAQVFVSRPFGLVSGSVPAFDLSCHTKSHLISISPYLTYHTLPHFNSCLNLPRLAFSSAHLLPRSSKKQTPSPAGHI